MCGGEREANVRLSIFNRPPSQRVPPSSSYSSSSCLCKAWKRKSGSSLSGGVWVGDGARQALQTTSVRSTCSRLVIKSDFTPQWAPLKTPLQGGTGQRYGSGIPVYGISLYPIPPFLLCFETKVHNETGAHMLLLPKCLLLVKVSSHLAAQSWLLNYSQFSKTLCRCAET